MVSDTMSTVMLRAVTAAADAVADVIAIGRVMYPIWLCSDVYLQANQFSERCKARAPKARSIANPGIQAVEFENSEGLVGKNVFPCHQLTAV